MISIIIPVLNEPSLRNLLYEVHEAMSDVPEQYEVLIVQGDRETEHYPYPELPHQRTVITYGDSLERSILNGFSHSEDKIIVMDADGSHPPYKIPEFCRALDSYEMVVGTRFDKSSVFKASPFRRLVSWGFIKLAKMAGSKLSDPMSGFFGIRRKLLERIRFKPIPWKTCLEIEIKMRPTLKEIPITFIERTEGESKTSLKVGLRILLELWWMAIS